MSLSVVIPMFNAEPFILRTLLSVASQIMVPREILLIDDGSTDASLDVLRALRSGRYRNSDISLPLKNLAKSLRVIQQGNSGPGAARNTALAEATTDWVAFLDADDLWYPDHLREIQTLINRFPDARLVGTSYQQHDFNSLQDSLPMRKPHSKSRVLIDYFALASKDVGIICSSAVAAHRESVIHAGGFGSWSAGEDLELWATLALKYPVAHSSHVTAIYVRHPKSQMGQMKSISHTDCPIQFLEDLSPSTKTVFQALTSGNHCVKETSLRMYLNGRLSSSVRANLVSGDVAAAKALVKLALRPRSSFLQAIRFFPAPFLRFASQLWRRFKASRRRFLK